MDTSIQNKLLWLVIVLLAIGEAALLVRVYGPAQSANPLSTAVQTIPSTPEQVVLPSIPAGAQVTVEGSIADLSSGSVRVLTPTNLQQSFSVSPDTAVVEQGPLKDAQTYAADLDRYSSEQEDGSAVEQLPPSRNVEISKKLSDLSKNLHVQVFGYVKSTDDVQAVKIVILP